MDVGVTVDIDVVRLTSLVVTFGGYPQSNSHLTITQVGLVECTSNKYHHASAIVTATLSDLTTYVVTSSTTFSARTTRRCSSWRRRCSPR